jgi:hypothetical protein
MVAVKVNLTELYTYLQNGKTGFVPWEVTLADGRKIKGLYRGFGAIVAVMVRPFAGQKGFRTLGPIEPDRNGNLWVVD